MSKIQLLIVDGSDRKQLFTADREVFCGRQDEKNDPDPVALVDCGDRYRLVLMPKAEKCFSRNWFSVTCDDQGQVTLRNLHLTHEVRLSDGRCFAAGNRQVVGADITINLGDGRWLRVAASLDQAENVLPKVDDKEFRVLDSVPLTPGKEVDVAATMTLGQFAKSDATAAVELIKIALKVVQKSAGSDAFIQAATQAATEIVGLDRARVLTLSGDCRPIADHSTFDPNSRWHSAAEFLSARVEPSQVPPISRNVLERVFTDRKTQIHDPKNKAFQPMQSVENVHSIVAAPILDYQGDVIGILYGDRFQGHSASGKRCISDLEGALVEVLAGALAGGFARQQEERLRSNLAGFFSPRVADLLAMQPELLRGRDLFVTVLFCDVRGFSAVTERLGPEKTIEWINEVLTELSRCVVDRDGVLVDYVGDELMAMWGAPNEQPNHSERAVNAAVAMLDTIAMLRERWSDRLPQQFGAGIGINTGIARVGNVGSDLKFKYGALGNTVNYSSRLQAATKQLGVDCLVSEQTIKEAGWRKKARRIATLKVVGIDQSMDVFEVVRCPNEAWFRLRIDYESALADYEAQNFAEATRKLGILIQLFPQDRPCRLLLMRAVIQIDQPDLEFSSAWVLNQK